MRGILHHSTHARRAGAFQPISSPKGACLLPQCHAKSLRPQPHPLKIQATSILPVGSISAVTLIRTDTTLDHSQKAERYNVPSIVLVI